MAVGLYVDTAGDGLGSAGGMVLLKDLGGLFQP